MVHVKSSTRAIHRAFASFEANICNVRPANSALQRDVKYAREWGRARVEEIIKADAVI